MQIWYYSLVLQWDGGVYEPKEIHNANLSGVDRDCHIATSFEKAAELHVILLPWDKKAGFSYSCSVYSVEVRIRQDTGMTTVSNACFSLRASVCVLQSACFSLRASVCVLQSACFSLRASVCVLQSACFSLCASACVLQSVCFSLRASVCVLQSACFSLRASVCVLQSACFSLCASVYMSTLIKE